MKWFVTLLFILCSSCWVSAGSAAECTVRLLNGDRVQGNYMGQDRAFVLLQTETLTDPLRIHGKYIDVLDFGKKTGTAPADYQVQFSSGQDLLGKDLKFSEGSMQFQTSWGGELIIDRNYVQRIKAIHGEDQVIFRGPGSPEKWEGVLLRKNPSRKLAKFLPQPAGEWVLEGKGELATNFPLLNRGIELQLGLEIPEAAVGDSFKIILEGMPGMTGVSEDLSGFIQLVMNHQSLTVEVIQPMKARRVMLGARKVVRGSIPRPLAGRLHLLLEYDTENQRYRVNAGDQVVSEWSSRLSLPAGNGYSPRLRFEWGLLSESLTIRDILLTLRDKPLPGESVEMTGGEEAVVFQNGDTLKARWEGLDEKGNWILALHGLDSHTTIEPQRIQMWLNHRNDLKRIRRLAGHVEVILSGGEGPFIVELVDADQDAFTFKREGWTGLYRIPVSRVEQVGFNPYF